MGSAQRVQVYGWIHFRKYKVGGGIVLIGVGCILFATRKDIAFSYT
jgi:hypothetical protein